MPTYQHPGVYLEEIPSGVKPIEGVATSICAFVGAATRGPSGEPTLVHNFDDYEAAFGPVSSNQDRMGLAVAAFYRNGGRDAYIMRVVSGAAGASQAASLPLDGETAPRVLTVSAANEGEWGSEVYIRVVKATTTALRFTLDVGHLETRDGASRFAVDESFASLSMSPRDDSFAVDVVNRSSRLVRLTLSDVSTVVGAGATSGRVLPADNNYFSNNIKGDLPLVLDVDGLGAKTITLRAGALTLAGTSNATDGAAVAAAIQAAVRALSATDPLRSVTVTYEASRQFTLNSPRSASSSLVVLDDPANPNSLAKRLGLDPASVTTVHGSAPIVPKAFPPATGAPAQNLAGGKAGTPRTQDYEAAFSRLAKVRDVSILVLPGQEMARGGGGNAAISAAVAHCEETRNRVVIIDPPQGLELNTAADVNALGLTTSIFAVCYYPWVKVPNPFFNPEGSTETPTLTIAPSALAAGVWSRIDGTRGVWKAPAGVEATLNGVAGLDQNPEDGEQDQLNPLGVNCFRRLPSFGPVVWGARTLATKANPEWRYVPVRRTAIMIEQSIYNGIQWAVFEPNDHRLWSSLRVNIGSFMDSLFRAGAFQGEKASDAYFVRCGLGDTMTQGDIDRGQVIVIVGFAPLKPAEFVIVRIQQKVQQ